MALFANIGSYVLDGVRECLVQRRNIVRELFVSNRSIDDTVEEHDRMLGKFPNAFSFFHPLNPGAWFLDKVDATPRADLERGALTIP